MRYGGFSSHEIFCSSEKPENLRLLLTLDHFLVLLPSLGSAQFGPDLAQAFGQKARLGSITFSKSLVSKNSANTSFLRLLKKIIGKALF